MNDNAHLDVIRKYSFILKKVYATVESYLQVPLKEGEIKEQKHYKSNLQDSIAPSC